MKETQDSFIEEKRKEYIHCEKRNIKGVWQDVCIIKAEKMPEDLLTTLKEAIAYGREEVLNKMRLNDWKEKPDTKHTKKDV